MPHQNHHHGFTEAMGHHGKGAHHEAFTKIQAMIENDLASGHDDGLAEAAKHKVPGPAAQAIVAATLAGFQAGHDTWVKDFHGGKAQPHPQQPREPREPHR